MEAAKYSPPCVPGHVAKQQLRCLSSIKGRYFGNEKSRETGGRRRDTTSTCSPTPGCQEPSQRWKEATVQSRKAERFTARWKRKVDLLPFAPSCSKPCSSSRPGSGARCPSQLSKSCTKHPALSLHQAMARLKKNPVVVHIRPTHLQRLTQWWPLLGALNSLKKLLRMSPASPEVTQQCRGLLKTFVKSFCKQNCHQVCLLHTALQTQVSDTTLTPAPRHGFPKLLSPGE